MTATFQRVVRENPETFFPYWKQHNSLGQVVPLLKASRLPNAYAGADAHSAEKCQIIEKKNAAKNYREAVFLYCL